MPAPVHVDEALIVVNKPSGLLSVPGRGPDKQDCAIHRVQQQYPDALIVHRLDQATSGLLLLARGAAMQRALSLDFAERRVEKTYEALVEATLTGPQATPAWQTIALPLMADWPRRPRQMVDAAQGKPSLTLWRLIAQEGSLARLALRPLTGRTHQLRVHLAALGWAIVGDTLYGGPPAARLMLHATQLSLPERGLHFESAAEF